MPSVRVREKINYAEIFGGKCEKCVDYVENTMDSVKILTVHKIDN